MSVKSLSIDLLRTNGGTQMRAELTQEVYMDYRDKWLAGVEFDPVDVFYDGSTYWLADGFHRFYGAREAKRASIPCRIHNGTQRDAILFSCKANAAHGLRRTNADKRRAVLAMLEDEEWVEWSDNKIADQAAVSVPFVASVRKELLTVNSSPAAKAADKPRLGRDGKKRRPPAQNPKKLPSQSDMPPTPAEDEPPQVEQPTPVKQFKDTFDHGANEEPAVGKLFSEALEHLRQLTLLLDRINKQAPNNDKRQDVFDSLECANTTIHEWRRKARAA